MSHVVFPAFLSAVCCMTILTLSDPARTDDAAAIGLGAALLFRTNPRGISRPGLGGMAIAGHGGRPQR